MGTTTQRGFTVIETMLFLAISTVLVIALLAGSGTSINIQRYHDSVIGLQSVLQDQYFQTINVKNIPPAGALSCTDNAVIVVDPASPLIARGRSNCVMLGRIITIKSNILTVDTVIGNTTDASGTSYENDIKELEAYNFSVLPDQSELYELEWGTEIAWPSIVDGTKVTGTTPRDFSMLILRAPSSGLVYTFSADGIIASNNLEKDMLIAGTEAPGRQGEQRLCIASGGTFNGGLAIFIKSYASSSNAIEVRSNDIDNGDNLSC